jgi:thiol:disulfide interchange protein DsbD
MNTTVVWLLTGLLFVAQPALTWQAQANPLDGLGAWLGTPADDEILPPEQAFQLTAQSPTGALLQLDWAIAPGTYLHQDKLRITSLSPEVSLGDYALPDAEIKPDSVRPDGSLGEVAAYYDALRLQIPLRRQAEATELRVQVAYQGCADRGICYPPQQQVLSVALPAWQGAVAEIPAVPAGAQSGWLQDLQSSASGWGWLLSLGLGVLVAFTACLYPMVPILSSLILGQGQSVGPARAFSLSLAYTQGIALTFGVLGAIMASLGQALGIQASLQTPWVLVPAIALFVLLALSLFGWFNLQIPAAWQSRLTALSGRRQGGSLWGVGLMGVLSALIVGPCGGPVLLAVLAFAAQAQHPLVGFGILWLFGTGMGLPLLLLGSGGGALLPRAGQWMAQVKTVGGVVLLALAISFLERLSPTYVAPAWILFAWGSLLVVLAVYLGALRRSRDGSGWQTLMQGFGLVALIYGALFLYGAAAGGKDTWQPLRGLTTGQAATTADHQLFQRIKTVADLEQALTQARSAGRPVMLDFYADWCTYCKTMEQQVFPQVREPLQAFVWLQADITRQDAADRALATHLGMIAPPALYFWNAAGVAQPGYHLVGEVGAAEILASAQGVMR